MKGQMAACGCVAVAGEDIVRFQIAIDGVIKEETHG